MASIDEKKFREDFRKGDIRSLYVLVSEDPYKLEYYSRHLKEKCKDSTKEILFADEASPPEIMDDIDSPSLWEPYKLVFVKQAEKFSAKEWDAFLPLLDSPKENSTLVFLMTKSDGRLKFFQSLSKAKDHAALVKMELMDAGEWNLWVQQFLRELQKDLSEDARQLLREWTADSLGELKQTLEKAALFCSGSTIEASHVRAIGYNSSSEDIFRFTEELLRGDRAAALVSMDKLLKQGEEPLAILGLLVRQYRWLLSILSLRAEGRSDQQIISECKLFPSAAKSLLPASRRVGGKGAIRGLESLAEADFVLKSSRVPSWQVMTQLVLQLT